MIRRRHSQAAVCLFLTVCFVLSGWSSMWHSASHLVVHSPLGERQSIAHAAINHETGHETDHHGSVILLAHLPGDAIHAHRVAPAEDRHHHKLTQNNPDTTNCQLLHLYADTSVAAAQPPTLTTLRISSDRDASHERLALHVEARLTPSIRAPPIGIS